MPKKVHESLTARTVASLRKPGYHIDGDGLYLQVTPGCAKTWVFRYMLRGKAREMGLGSLSRLSLAEARVEAKKQREVLRKGIDPIEARAASRAAQALESARSMSFKECADSYIEGNRASWKNAKHATQWENTLRDFALYHSDDRQKDVKERRPLLRDLPVSSIDTPEVLLVLEPIWRSTPETAARLRGRIEAILDWARVRKYRSGENPARWRGHLDKILPKRSKVQKVRHHPALPFTEAGAFMKTLREHDGTAARALEFIILTAARTGEAIAAQWGEIDLEEGVWTVPASRMKARKEHKVPLAPDAIALLKRLPKVSGCDFVFPGARKGKHLSNMACLKLLDRMGRKDLTVHGFRSTFRDWAAECTNFPREVAEAALAHAVGDKVEAAYRRGDAFKKRSLLMAAWAGHCAKEGSAKVHRMHDKPRARAA
jgi:integrase